MLESRGQTHANEAPGIATRRLRLRRSEAPLLFLIPAILVAIVMLAPIVYLAIRATEAGTATWDLLYRQRTAELLGNTLRLAAGVTLASILIALPLAWFINCTDLRWRRFWGVLAPLPLVIPSYAGTIAVIGALGPRGLFQEWLEPLGVQKLPSIYGYWGAWVTLTLFTYPYIYLSVSAAFRRIDPAFEEASRTLRRGSVSTFLRVTLPQLRPSIVSGGLLSILYVISDFGVVTLMRYDTFTRAIYTQYRAAFDRTLAAALSVVLIALAVSLLAGEGALRGKSKYHRVGTGAATNRPLVSLGRWNIPAMGFCALVILAALGVPIVTMTYWLLTGASSGHQLSDLPRAALHSVLLAVLSSFAVLVCAFPVAMLAARHSTDRISRVLERVSYLGYALPGIVVALAFVFVGARYLTALYQTLPLLIIAMSVKYLSQGVGALRATILQVSPRLEESARVLGRSPLSTIRAVTLPLITPGVGAAFYLTFLAVMKELPITLLLSPTGFDTLAVEIWSATDAGSYGRAAAPTLLIIVISAVPTVLFSRRPANTARDRIEEIPA